MNNKGFLPVMWTNVEQNRASDDDKKNKEYRNIVATSAYSFAVIKTWYCTC